MDFYQVKVNTNIQLREATTSFLVQWFFKPNIRCVTATQRK